MWKTHTDSIAIRLPINKYQPLSYGFVTRKAKQEQRRDTTRGAPTINNSTLNRMKTKTTLLFLLFILFLPMQPLWAQTEKAFPQHIWINANAVEKDGSRFGYEKSSFTPILKDCRTLPKTDPCHEADEYEEKTLLGRYKNASMKEQVNILYSPGPSSDPHFLITDKNGKEIWTENAEEMCMNSNGIIYTSGNMNKMFNIRMKFQLADGKITEVKQPFYYVNVKGKLLKPVKLYSQKRDGIVVATLPVGYEIEVLLAEADTPTDEDGYKELPMNYLARTDFGLVGWLRLTEDDTYYLDPVIKGLGFYGD